MEVYKKRELYGMCCLFVADIYYLFYFSMVVSVMAMLCSLFDIGCFFSVFDNFFSFWISVSQCCW